MMAGKRLLDLAALFNASRGVAQKHVALRTRQFDAYSRTSSLAKAVRSQTDRVTETIKAASILTSRLNENAPAWTAEVKQESTSNHANTSQPIPSKAATEAGSPRPAPKAGVEQDHFYERSKQNSAVDPPPAEALDIQQEAADRYPLPDGTIPPKESNLNTPRIDKDSTSEIPTGEPAKEPTRNHGLHVQQEKAERYPLPDGTIPSTNADMNIPKADIDFTSTRPVNEVAQTPLNSEGFQPVSSGASTILGPNKSHASSDELRKVQRQHEFQIPSRVADAEDDTATTDLEKGHDKDSFYRRSGHTSPTLSSLPRVKIPKNPSNVQAGDSHLPDAKINSDSYYNPTETTKSSPIPSVEAVPEQEQLPEGINTDLFHSPRVARLLGGKTQRSTRDDLKLRRAQDAPVERTPLSAGRDQDTFNARTPEAVNPEPDLESTRTTVTEQEVDQLRKEIEKETHRNTVATGDDLAHESTPYALRESKVPSSRLGRIWNYGGLAAGMFGGAITESIRRVSGNGGEGSYMLSAANMDRLVTKLSRMRGAALKLGQMLSFQDSKMLPAPIQEVLQRVQDRADYMPASQRDKVLAANLGADWRDIFSSFEEVPLAAASIGQVHSAVIKSTGERVAVKVQYPGVADSIDSDLKNLAILLTASRLLPKGLFLDKTIANARVELGWECDYLREAECGRRFQDLLIDETEVFVVPKVYPEASGKQVLTMKFMDGIGVTRVQSFTQEQRDWIGTQILRLCLREITEFRFMQTDPNWTNFLYNAKTNKLELLDFGASREYPAVFITKYTQLLEAASRSDKDTIRDLSIDLGYLTGHESKAMLNAHLTSILTLAEPFLESSPEVYDFKDQTITERVKEQIPIMIRERLAPPPEETYSLHRKLSGAFLLCARLGSRVRCRDLFVDSMKKGGF
ncbi:Protein ABC1-like protein, mitochondrial [Phlyctema vagabunda]|uniref:Protein ABC1-like protein, mitochondrial n=1 Tax=Phlyctema vagabunda TaxID=108571 RepID=A0ABR4PV18_9HELO